ncbi:MAG TPA: TIGR03087 family PEP-CTERM/XrtA system glycosyltransferase [Candidatus Tectomicrobia bacterium]|nr:TIGR03087 family PEP-CTERM/XrtA system glycosyltransferase [Candidatus Tectomicrobia bacterium]
MRILMLAHRLPYPPTTGDKVRAYHVARHLAASHRLTLACLVDEPLPAERIAAFRRWVPDVEHVVIDRRRHRARALLGLAAGASATVRYFDAPGLRRRVEARLREASFDLVYVSSSSMAQYVPAPAPAPVVMDFVDVDSDKWAQYAARLAFPASLVYGLEARRLRRAEQAAAAAAAHCLVATREEQRLLLAIAPDAPSTVVANGVDLEYFAPRPAPGTAPTIVFTGAMDYFPNVDAVVHFADGAFRLVRRRVPDARFVIVGKNPARAVRQLGSREGVEVVGGVPDVRPYLREALVAVAPLRVARGVQNKVLEAMAMGLPVVASPKAFEGLEAEPGRDLVVAHGEETFADAVVALLGDRDARRRMGAAARRFVEERHAWPVTLAPLDRVVADVGAPMSGRVRQPRLETAERGRTAAAPATGGRP